MNKSKILRKINTFIICGLFISGTVNAKTYYGSDYQNYNNEYKQKYQFNNNNQSVSVQKTEAPKTNVASTSTQEKIYYVKGSQPCWDQAAKYHGVDPWLLYSIAFVESGFNPTAYNGNKNGSYDLGMMQINSIWLPQLKKMGVSREMLKDACTATYVGAWILSKNIKRFGYTWRAIGAYNSAKPELGYKYAKKVYKAHYQFTGKTAGNWK